MVYYITRCNPDGSYGMKPGCEGEVYDDIRFSQAGDVFDVVHLWGVMNAGEPIDNEEVHQIFDHLLDKYGMTREEIHIN